MKEQEKQQEIKNEEKRLSDFDIRTRYHYLLQVTRVEANEDDRRFLAYKGIKEGALVYFLSEYSDNFYETTAVVAKGRDEHKDRVIFAKESLKDIYVKIIE